MGSGWSVSARPVCLENPPRAPLESVPGQVPCHGYTFCRVCLDENFILATESFGRTRELPFSNHLEPSLESVAKGQAANTPIVRRRAIF